MITKCLLPAAGLGTRFLPITKTIPKEMLPIGNKPLMEYAVLEAMEAGINEIGIITSKYKKAIEDYFDCNVELHEQIKGSDKEALLKDINYIIENAHFSYTRQKQAKGLGDAILSGENLIGNMPTAVILADDLCINASGSGVLTQMVKLYEQYKCSIIAVEEIDIKHSASYGIVDGNYIEDDVIDITAMVEKPTSKNAPTNLAIIGRYILTPDIFDIIRHTKPGKGGEVQITDALMTQAKTARVLGYKFTGRRFDCGSVEGFLKAANHFITT